MRRGASAEPWQIQMLFDLGFALVGSVPGFAFGGLLGFLIPLPRPRLPSGRVLLSSAAVVVIAGTAYLALVRPKQIEQRNQEDMLEAFESGDINELRAVIREGASPDTTVGEGTALFSAAEHGMAGFCGYLIVHGANLDSRNAGGKTPLLVALETDHGDVARLLLDYGADPVIADDHGVTPLMLAAAGYATQRNDNIELIDMLVSKGADVNAITLTYPYSPLMGAIAGESVKNAEHLLSLGADPNLSPQAGEFPLDYARKLRRPAMVDLLTAHGALSAK